MKKGDDKKIEEKTELLKDIKAPIKKGDVIGKVYYKIGDETVFESEIKASESVEKAKFFDVFLSVLRSAFSVDK